MERLSLKSIEDPFMIFLRRLNAKFSGSTIKKLKKHPDFPSLFAFSHTLKELGIENLALQSSYEQIQHELPKPLLVHMNYNAFLVVERLDDEGVYFFMKQNKISFQDKSSFIESWSGYTMIVDLEAKGLEEEYAVNKIKEVVGKIKLPFIACSLAFLAGYTIYFNTSLFNLYASLFLINKVFGITFCTLLLIHLADKNNLFVKKICSSKKNNDKVSCASILDSNAANFIGVFPWSEIGMIYFVSLFVYSFLFIKASSPALVAIISIIISPYTLYSVFYQWKIAKQWCRLCLAVQCIIILDLILGLFFLFSVKENIWSLIPLQSFLALSLSFLLTTSMYVLLKPSFFDLKKFKSQVAHLNKIRLNLDVFSSLLNSSRQLKINELELNPVKLGNPSGKHRLTIITNPSCDPCTKMHKVLFKILENNKNTSVNEIFLTEENEQDKSYQISEFFLQLYLKEDSITFNKAISSYYSDLGHRNNFNDWKKMYNISETYDELNSAKNILKKHNAWCREKQIFSTPLLFYNDRLLPKEYTIDDLVYFLD